MAVNEANERRRKLGARMTYLCATRPQFMDRVAPRQPDGTRSLVVALGSDTLPEVFNLVAQAGGTARVVVQSTENNTSVISFATVVAVPVEEHDDPTVPVADACTIEDLLRVLRPGTSIKVELCGQEYAFEGDVPGLAADGGAELAPA